MIAVLAVVAVAGCTSDAPASPVVGTTTPSGQSSTSQAPRPFATYVRSGQGNDSAAIAGRLTLQRDCLVVVRDDGKAFALLMPSDAVLDPGGTLQLLGGSFRLGDQVRWTGSYQDPMPQALPADCPGGQVAMVQGVS